MTLTSFNLQLFREQYKHILTFYMNRNSTQARLFRHKMPGILEHQLQKETNTHMQKLCAKNQIRPLRKTLKCT